MNNSIGRKINENQEINLEKIELSSTSSEFISKLNYNKKTIKQKGGNCDCKDLFKSIKNENFELILYILKQNNCCFKCNDSNGDTCLHLLIPFYEKNKEIANTIDNILLNQNCSDFINIQNNQGQTPMLIAVMNDLNDLAEKMENCGADPSIQDNQGNFISEKSNKTQDETGIVTDVENESKIEKNVLNIISLIIPKQTNNDLTSLNLEDTVLNDTVDLDTDNFMKGIKSKIDTFVGKNEDNSSSSSEYEMFPKKNFKDKMSSDTLNTDKFISLLGRDGTSMGIVNYPSNVDDDNTEQFIATLRNKYNAVSETDKNSKHNESRGKFKQTISNSDTLAGILSSSDNPNQPESETSPNASELDINNADIKKYINETTSDELQEPNESNLNSKSKYGVFLKNKIKYDKNNSLTSEIDTNTLLRAIKKIQTNNVIESEQLKGGAITNKKQSMIGHRKLVSDSDKSIKMNKNLLSNEYDMLYNTDSELGKKSKINELSRMMISQKEKLHNEVLEIIMGMLNNGLLTQSNKPIEANERNAKLIKAYIYRQISEKNPQMGGMDKILTFKTMSENEIINTVKKMPNLDELEKSIQKHIEEKKSKNILETSETSESSEKPKKSSKKTSKKK